MSETPCLRRLHGFLQYTLCITDIGVVRQFCCEYVCIACIENY